MRKRGDLLWLNCFPGGVCIFLKVSWRCGANVDFLIIHPTLGVVEMADHYLIPFEDAIEHEDEVDFVSSLDG
tara:strand:- start:389 stop:604 length:216 start_codon:yes stop_codon:yes gene_type:complete